ncbi:Zn2Cys6 transcriptional regulator [Trichoderma parareesei]|uniref:Zn2Cys6 transcriptional regulator n=1 Tax=Trichoderma parareesei TaxID=858221 RepID=A0A2H2ZJE2_TRIPA|nr:Zn2Cys6 transcriptional regulator [Trichoderma parareesei]
MSARQDEDQRLQAQAQAQAQVQAPLSLYRERLKIANACQSCRASKVKCDGGRPVAAPTPVTAQASPLIAQDYSLQTPSATQTPSTTGFSGSSDLEHVHEDRDESRAFYAAHGRFAGEVSSTIDKMAGLSPDTTCSLVPFVDAPLFGDVGEPPRNVVLDFASDLPRGYADRLLAIYWHHVHPVEPVLDQQQFCRTYDAFYSGSGTPLHVDCDIWLSTLNIVFALAVQIQESIPLQKRDDEANRYFQRAWALLRPEAILWKPGSLELVQCLLLMNRYLHCTNNQQKTSMTATLAIRIVQNMVCHTSEESSASDADRDLRHKVWASCVALERPALLTGHGSDFHAWELELHEIGTHIQLAQVQSKNSMATKLGLPRLYQQDEYHAIAVQLDGCLNKWEKSLPDDWRLQNMHMIHDRRARAERYLLHFRLLHSRIYLHRPMLARLYAIKSHAPTAAAASDPSTISDRLLQECARMCLEAAQNLTSLIAEIHDPNEPIGILPWWYRVYYLHIAGIHFLAAMFASDLFTPSVERAWYQVLAALRAHEHLSLYVQQCARTFETLAARILNARCLSVNGNGIMASDDGAPGLFLDDMFQDVNFDLDEFLFSVDDTGRRTNY